MYLPKGGGVVVAGIGVVLPALRGLALAGRTEEK